MNSRYPNPSGLSVVDVTGILTGNDGIDVGVWTPPGEPERPTLPGHEHQIGGEIEPPLVLRRAA